MMSYFRQELNRKITIKKAEEYVRLLLEKLSR
jgi:hypothetical protein